LATPLQEDINYKIVPENQKYENIKKQGHLIVKFEKLEKRKFCFEDSPFPG
jgi:hypothetical protein